MQGTEDSLPVKNFSSLLRQTLKDDFTIEKLSWENLTEPGENYGSLIIAVDMTIRRKSMPELYPVVVKLPPPSPWLQELFNTPLTFRKELQFYRDITPAFIALQRENNIFAPEEKWLAAKYFGGRMGLGDNDEFDNQAAIVLINLNLNGYWTVDRMVGLNFNQAELAVRRLAELHGIAIAMRTLKPETFEKLIIPALEQPANETAKNCLGDMIEKAMNDLNKIPQCDKYIKKVRKTMEYIESMESSTKNETKDQWATLVHNDFWVNNMMFSIDASTGNAVDMKIVDFQLCIYDYGVNDLIFFLVSSPTIEVMEKDFDRLIDIYYDNFIGTLKQMKIDTSNFPKEQLVDRFDRCAPMKFAQCLMMTQVIKSKPDVVPKMEDINSKESFLTIGSGEVYQRKMFHTVEFFDKRGWLKE